MGINFVALALFLFIIAIGVLGFLFGRLRPPKEAASQRFEARLESEARKLQPGCYF